MSAAIDASMTDARNQQAPCGRCTSHCGHLNQQKLNCGMLFSQVLAYFCRQAADFGFLTKYGRVAKKIGYKPSQRAGGRQYF